MHKDKHLQAWEFRLQIICASDLIYLYSAPVIPKRGHASVHPRASITRKFTKTEVLLHSVAILFFLVHSSESFLASKSFH